MNRFYDEKCDASLLSPLTLAFVGDTVFDLFVRERLVCQANRPVKKLHNLAAQQVNAAAQANYVSLLMPCLSKKEIGVLKKGRNAHTNHKAKNMSESDYHAATGLEALFGYLYLDGQLERLRELFEIICRETEDG
ncbi:MAG: Mini-ribonuclease 3 [Acutalibacteraceae bacterium]